MVTEWTCLHKSTIRSSLTRFSILPHPIAVCFENSSGSPSSTVGSEAMRSTFSLVCEYLWNLPRSKGVGQSIDLFVAAKFIVNFTWIFSLVAKGRQATMIACRMLLDPPIDNASAQIPSFYPWHRARVFSTSVRFCSALVGKGRRGSDSGNIGVIGRLPLLSSALFVCFVQTQLGID